MNSSIMIKSHESEEFCAHCRYRNDFEGCYRLEASKYCYGRIASGLEIPDFTTTNEDGHGWLIMGGKIVKFMPIVVTLTGVRVIEATYEDDHVMYAVSVRAGDYFMYDSMEEALRSVRGL